jgi:signal transduction histidine kinase
VTVQAEDVGRPGPDVEAALYFCVLEALQNVAKHAPDASVAVRLATEADTGDLVLAVQDDGPGFDRHGESAGQGQQNMVDRMGAVGGTVTWASTPGSGTTVELRLPRQDGAS